jgi:flagellar basal body-associated protein FliL
METPDFWLKVFGTFLSLAGLVAAVYNIATSRSNAKQLAKERHDAEKLDAVCLLAAKTQERVTAVEGRQNNFENRIERRIDQIAGDIGKVKDLFTDYLIKH